MRLVWIRHHIGLVVFGCLTVGLLLGFGLAFLQPAGGAETTISVYLLLAFSLAWAAIAIISSRYTDQPQLWAAVPAILLAGLAGVLLIWPGLYIEAFIGWLWPIALLALLAWIAVQSRRRLHSPIRAWLLYPTVGVLSLMAMGGIYETVQEAGRPLSDSRPGELVDVGGHRMHLYCSGSGSPTVILDAGLGGSSLDWSPVQPSLAESTKVCSYDRAGMGWSDGGPQPRSPEQVAKELHVLLTNAGISPPYVLVGHSLGGKNVRMFALEHPDEVVGMVLVDARSEYVDDRLSSSEKSMQKRAANLQAWGFGVARRIGLARIAGASLLGTPPSLSGETQRTIALLATAPNSRNTATDEFMERSTSDDMLRDAPSLGDRPVVVLAASKSMEDLAFWPESQQFQAALSIEGQLIIVEDSGHSIHWDHPAEVIAAVQTVIANSR
jgi:pimeloyl-ACP methyl ester carboxylesterase